MLRDAPQGLAAVTLSRFQSTALVLLRTLIGWHFLYEGYYKLVLPGWTRVGDPVAAWSSAGYLRNATGPLGVMFHAIADTRALAVVDLLVPIGLLLVGLALVTGLFTQSGCIGALMFLIVFYLSAVPTTGAPQAGAEGTYLIVNKNLVEMGAVLVVLAFRTGRVAGLDLMRPR